MYDHAQIVDWLGVHTVAKAQPYCRSVSHVSWTDNTLAGRVQLAPWRSHTSLVPRTAATNASQRPFTQERDVAGQEPTAKPAADARQSQDQHARPDSQSSTHEASAAETYALMRGFDAIANPCGSLGQKHRTCEALPTAISQKLSQQDAAAISKSTCAAGAPGKSGSSTTNSVPEVGP